MQKLFILLLSLFSFLVSDAQSYGPQTPITINGIVCLLHLPSNYNTESPTQKHPFIIWFQGKGEFGTNPSNATIHGTGQALAAGTWTGGATNPTTHVYEDFIVLSTLSASNGGFNNAQIDGLLTYMFTNYRIDPTCWATMGLSQGGGEAIFYPSHINFTNLNPPNYTYYTPAYRATSVVAFSADNNCCDPVNYFVQDGIHFLGLGNQQDIHGITTSQFATNVKNAGGDATYIEYPCNSGNPIGHDCWDGKFDSAYTVTVYNQSMNIYQFILYNRSGTITPPNSISTGSITSPLCITAVSGINIKVPFSSVGTYTSNTYTAQLSDANGSFTNPKTIGSKVSNLNTDTISATIPANLAGGTKYRIRVISNNPAVTGTDNGSNITITLASNSIAPSAPQSISINTNGNTLTVTEGSAPNSRQWYDGTTPIAGATGTTFTPNYSTAGSHSITCHSVYSCGTMISNAVSITVSVPSPTRVYINPVGGGANLIGCDGSFKYNPGDTLVFRSVINGVPVIWNRIYLHCINDVTLINEGRTPLGDWYNNGTLQVPGGFVLDNCSHIHLTGTGTTGITYGFVDSSTQYRGIGVQIVGASDYIEIDHMEILQRNAGIWDKTEQLDNKCYDSLAFPMMVMHDHNIHDNYIHGILNEGMYIGSTAPNSNDTSAYNQHPKVYCPDGSLNTTLTARMGNIHIYNNIVDSTGRGGIQLSSADSGTNLIFGNTITRSGYNGEYGQGNGIAIGGYTHADVHDNIIRSTTAASIFILGSGLNRVYNNIIDSSGIKRDGSHLGTNPNIEIDTRDVSNPSPGHANPELLTFQVYNNTVLSKTGSYNIVLDRTFNTFDPTGSYICNSGNVYNGSNVPYNSNCGITPSITTGSVPAGSFCVSPAKTATFILSFQSVGTYNSGNQYQVQLSDKNGSFTSFTVIGTYSSVANSGNINCTIPTGTATGTTYKLRVVSTSPSVIGTVSSPFIINLASNSISPTGEQDILTNANGDVITVSETSTPISRQWYSNNSPITGQTATTYTPKFTTAGTYIVYCKSLFSCDTITSNKDTIVVTDPTPPPPLTISTGAIANTPFCVTAISGRNVSVTYSSKNGTFNAGNKFKVRLSNANGSFSVVVNIGMITSTATSGTIPCIIPPNTPTGTKYRIRVISTNPKVVGSNNGTNLTINLASDTISPSTQQSILQGTNGNTLTVKEGSTPISRQWYVGNSAIVGATSTTFIPNFQLPGTYNVTCHSTYTTCGEIISNTVQIVVGAIPPPPPPDTVCVYVPVTHDSLFQKIDTFHTSIPVYTYTKVCDTFHYWFIRWTTNCRFDSAITSYRDSVSYDTFYVTKPTTHDSLECTIIPSVNMGVYYFNAGTVPIPIMIDTVKNYIGVKNIRQNFTRGGGNVYDSSVIREIDSGLNVLLTVNNSTDGAIGFATFLDSIMNRGRPTILSIRNEPTQNSPSMAAYLQDLTAAIPIAHARGVKITNGGITRDVVYYMAYTWLNSGNQTYIDSANNWLIPTLHLNMSSPAAIKAIGQYDTLFRVYDTLNLDYINLHWYEPSQTDTSVTTVSGVLPIVSNFIYTRLNNKPLMSDEFGTYNHSCGLLNDLVTEAIASHFKYLIYFDGNTIPAIKNQDCFKQIIQNLH